MPFNYSRSVVLLLLVAFLGFSQASFAGFVIKPVVGISVSSTESNPATDSSRHRLKSRDEAFREGNRVPRRHRVREHSNDEGREGSGWAATLAFVFACMFYGPLAILFGAIGMQKGHRNRGMAKGAFIAGIVETALTVVLYLFIFLLIYGA